MCIRRTKSHIAKQEIEFPTLKYMTEFFPSVQDILLCLILISNHPLLQASESWYFRCRVFLLKGVLDGKKVHMQRKRPLNSKYLNGIFPGITSVEPHSNARSKFHFQRHMGSFQSSTMYL